MTQETLDVKVIDGKTKTFDSQRKKFRITYKTKSQEQQPVRHVKEDK